MGAALIRNAFADRLAIALGALPHSKLSRKHAGLRASDGHCHLLALSAEGARRGMRFSLGKRGLSSYTHCPRVLADKEGLL